MAMKKETNPGWINVREGRLLRENLVLRRVGLVVMISCLTVFALGVDAARAWECQLIRIYNDVTEDGGEEAYIEPQVLSTVTETCVIIVNLSKKTTVKVSFCDGTQCQLGTRAPSGFSLEQNSGVLEEMKPPAGKDLCYSTAEMPQGGTASLSFVEKGEYPFVVIVDNEIKAKGSIVVK